MNAAFYENNRIALGKHLQPGDVAVLYSGGAFRKTADEFFFHYANRNFVYMAGITQAESVLLCHMSETGLKQTLYMLPPNPMFERWNGRRLTFKEAEEASGISDVRSTTQFDADFDALFTRQGGKRLWLDFDKFYRGEPDSPAYKMADYARERFPHVCLENLLTVMKSLRSIKVPCEIEAMRKAEELTYAGILAMMKAAKPGMYEYQLKAQFEYAVAMGGGEPAFPLIVSSGSNNFCIHYTSCDGMINEGDMILNDVGARWDFLGTDVSRGWPVSGKFSEKQRILYECAYATSEYMFGLIKPGMHHAEVDATIKKYNFERMKDAGVLDKFEDIGKYMWHGGAHHVGFDTHDIVDVVEKNSVLQPGMVFCVDIGIYHEDWGVGFRLEDNCVITETGCENLSAAIPRSIADIEAAMGR